MQTNQRQKLDGHLDPGFGTDILKRPNKTCLNAKSQKNDGIHIFYFVVTT